MRPEPRRKRPARTIALVMIAIDVVLAMVFVVVVRSPTAPTSTEPGTRPSVAPDALTQAVVTTPIAAVTPPTDLPPTPPVTPTVQAQPTAVVFYANCTEAKAAGVTPLHRGDPGYSAELDRDDDGDACE